MANEINVPVKLLIENLQAIVGDMHKLLGTLKVDSSSYKKLSSIIADVEKRILNLLVQSARPFINDKLFLGLNKEISHIYDDLTKIRLEAGSIKFNDLSLDSSSKQRLLEFNNEIKAINDLLKTVKENAKNTFLESDAGKAWKDANPKDAAKSFEGITKVIEELVNKQESLYNKAKTDYKDYKNTLEASENLNTFIKNGHELSELNIGKDLYNKIFDKNKNFKARGRSLLSSWLQEQFRLDPSTANELVQDTGKKVREAFAQAEGEVEKFLKLRLIEINGKAEAARTSSNNGKTYTENIANEKIKLDAIKLTLSTLTETNIAAEATERSLNTQRELSIQKLEALKESLVAQKRETLGMVLPIAQAKNELASMTAAFSAGQERLAKLDAATSKLLGISNFVNRYVGAYAIIRKVTLAIRDAFSNIKELDKVITNIAVVTNMSLEDLWNKVGQYTQMAQEYGVMTKDVYTVSLIFYQQGLLTSLVMDLTTETLKMAKIAGMEYGAAANAMTVAVRAFKIEMSEALQVTDTYSALAAKFAVSSAEIANAMEKTASSAANVGMSLQSTSAFMSVMIQTTRESALNIGSALKSIISRYGEMKASPSSLINVDGEEVAFNKVDTALSSIGISIKDAAGQFRDFDDVIMELASKWDTLDNNTQRYIATIMAGNRQQSRFIALVSNYDELKRAMSTANDAENASIVLVAKTMDSLESKTNQLKNAFSLLYLDLHIESGLKDIYDWLTRIITTVGKLGTGGALATLTNIFGFGMGAKGIVHNVLDVVNYLRKQTLVNIDLSVNGSPAPEGALEVGTLVANDVTNSLINTTESNLPAIRSAGESEGTEFINGLRDGMGTHSDSVYGAAATQDVVNSIIHTAEAGLESVRSAGENLGNAYITGLTNRLQEVNGVLAADMAYTSNPGYRQALQDMSAFMQSSAYKSAMGPNARTDSMGLTHSLMYWDSGAANDSWEKFIKARDSASPEVLQAVTDAIMGKLISPQYKEQVNKIISPVGLVNIRRDAGVYGYTNVLNNTRTLEAALADLFRPGALNLLGDTMGLYFITPDVLKQLNERPLTDELRLALEEEKVALEQRKAAFEAERAAALEVMLKEAEANKAELLAKEKEEKTPTPNEKSAEPTIEDKVETSITKDSEESPIPVEVTAKNPELVVEDVKETTETTPEIEIPVKPPQIESDYLDDEDVADAIENGDYLYNGDNELSFNKITEGATTATNAIHETTEAVEELNNKLLLAKTSGEAMGLSTALGAQDAEVLERKLEESVDKTNKALRDQRQAGLEAGQGVTEGALTAGNALEGLWSKIKNSKAGQWIKDHNRLLISLGANVMRMAGTAITAVGAAHEDKSTEGREYSKLYTGLGNGISMAGTGASMLLGLGPWGALAGAVGGFLIGGLGSIIDGLHMSLEERLELEKNEAKKLSDNALKEQAKSTDIQTSLENISLLLKAMYNSAEDMLAYKDAMNTLGLSYPELISTYDSMGNAIIDLLDAEYTLMLARYSAAKAAREAAVGEKTARDTLREIISGTLTTISEMLDNPLKYSTITDDANRMKNQNLSNENEYDDGIYFLYKKIEEANKNNKDFETYQKNHPELLTALNNYEEADYNSEDYWTLDNRRAMVAFIDYMSLIPSFDAWGNGQEYHTNTGAGYAMSKEVFDEYKNNFGYLFDENIAAPTYSHIDEFVNELTKLLQTLAPHLGLDDTITAESFFGWTDKTTLTLDDLIDAKKLLTSKVEGTFANFDVLDKSIARNYANEALLDALLNSNKTGKLQLLFSQNGIFTSLITNGLERAAADATLGTMTAADWAVNEKTKSLFEEAKRNIIDTFMQDIANWSDSDISTFIEATTDMTQYLNETDLFAAAGILSGTEIANNLAAEYAKANQVNRDRILKTIYGDEELTTLNSLLAGLEKYTVDGHNAALDIAERFKEVDGSSEILSKYSNYFTSQLLEINNLAEDGYTLLAGNRLNILSALANSLSLIKNSTIQLDLFSILTSINFADYDSITNAAEKIESYLNTNGSTEETLALLDTLKEASGNLLFNVNTLALNLADSITNSAKEIDSILTTNKSGLDLSKALDQLNNLNVARSAEEAFKFNEIYQFDATLGKYVYTIDGLKAAIGSTEGNLRAEAELLLLTVDKYASSDKIAGILKLYSQYMFFEQGGPTVEDLVSPLTSFSIISQDSADIYSDLAEQFLLLYEGKETEATWSKWIEFLKTRQETDEHAKELIDLQLEAYETNTKNQLFTSIDWAALDLGTDTGTNKVLMDSLIEALKMNTDATWSEVVDKYLEELYPEDIESRARARAKLDDSMMLTKVSEYLSAISNLLTVNADKVLTQETKDVAKHLNINVNEVENSTESALQAASAFLNALASSIGQGGYTLEQYNKDASSILERSLNNQSFGKSLLDFAKEDTISASTLEGLANTLNKKLSDLVNVATGELQDDLLKQYLTFDANTGGYKLLLPFDKFVEALNKKYGNVIDTTSRLYIDALKSINDKAITDANAIHKNISEEINKVVQSKGNELLNLSETFSQLDEDTTKALNEKLKGYGASLEHGILTLAQDANIVEVTRAIADAAASKGLLLESEIEALGDAIEQFLTTVTNNITSGIKGSLSNSGARELLTWAKTNGLGDLSFIKTKNGLKLSNDLATKLYETLSKIDAISALIVLDELNKSIEESVTNTTKLSGEIAQLRATAESDDFKFMEHKIPSGLNNPINYFNNWSKAFSTMLEAMLGVGADKGKMDYQNFYNIITEMSNLAAATSGQVFTLGENFEVNATNAAELIERGANALSVAADGTVKVDLSKLGIDFSTGADELKQNVGNGIKKVAESLVKMLESMIKLMEVIVAMEELGEADLDSDNKLELGEIFDFGDLEVNEENLEKVTKFTETYREALQKLINFGNSKEGKEFKESAEAMKITWNGADKTMWDLLTTSEETVLSWSKELRGSYAAIINAFYLAAKSGDFDPDNIMASIKEILAGTGYEGEITIGDMHLVFNSGVAFEKDENGNIIYNGRKFSGSNALKDATLACKTDLLNDVLDEVRGEVKQDENGDSYIETTVDLGTVSIQSTYNIAADRYEARFSDGGFVYSDTAEGLKAAILHYAYMQKIDLETTTPSKNEDVLTYSIQRRGEISVDWTVDVKTGLVQYVTPELVSGVLGIALSQQHAASLGFTYTVPKEETTGEIENPNFKVKEGSTATLDLTGAKITLAGVDDGIELDTVPDVKLAEGQTLTLDTSNSEVNLDILSGEENPSIDINVNTRKGDQEVDILDNIGAGVLPALEQEINAFVSSYNESSDAAANKEALVNGLTAIVTSYEDLIPESLLKPITGFIGILSEYDDSLISASQLQFATLLGLTAYIETFEDAPNANIVSAKLKAVEALIAAFITDGNTQVDTTEISALTATIVRFLSDGADLDESLIDHLTAVVTNYVTDPNANTDELEKITLEILCENNETRELLELNLDTAKKGVTLNISTDNNETTKELLNNVSEAAEGVILPIEPGPNAVIGVIDSNVSYAAKHPVVQSVKLEYLGGYLLGDTFYFNLPKTNNTRKPGAIAPDEVTSTPGGATGNVALAGGTKTLMGELGPELVVSHGKYFLVGVNGPEFVNLDDDAIVFNHLQTQQLFGNGMTRTRGHAVTNERNAVALAGGTTGPAMASAKSILGTLKQLLALWKALLDMSTKDLAGLGGAGGGKGGGGGSNKDNAAKAALFTKELEKWYNWLLRISILGKKLNYEEKLRAKIASDMYAHGQDYTKSLLQSLNYLQELIATEMSLVASLKEYFETRRTELNNSPLSSLREFDKYGLLKYKPGALYAFSELLKREPNNRPRFNALLLYEILVEAGYGDFMKYTSSGEEIVKETEVNSEGQTVEKADLSNFYTQANLAFWEQEEAERLEMLSLRDSIELYEAEILEKLAEANEIMREIELNLISVEDKVLKAIVDTREREIEELLSTRDAMEEAANELILGLSDLLSKEKDMYLRQSNLDELTKLLRQLAILLRSGGSASQIAGLQKEITLKLQDAYFDALQRQIDALKEASDAELARLDNLIELMTETLAYEKLFGLLWEQVYLVMQGTPEQITDFIILNTREYWGESPTKLTADTRDILHEVLRWVEFRDSVDEGIDGLAAMFSDKTLELKALSITEEMDSKLDQAYLNFSDGANRIIKAIEDKEISLNLVINNYETPASTPASSGDTGSGTGTGATLPATSEDNLPRTKTVYEFDGKLYDTKEAALEARAMLINTYKNMYESSQRAGMYDTANVGLLNMNKYLSMYPIPKKVTYDRGGMVEQTGPAILHAKESVLTSEQTSILRNDILSNKPTSLLSLLTDFRDAYNGIPNASAYNTVNNGGVTIENATVEMNVSKISNDYDAQRAGEQALEKMMQIARKTSALNRIGR